MRRRSLLLAACLAASSAAFGQISLTTIGTPYTQDFDNLLDPVPTDNSTVAASVLPVGWTFSESGTNANTTIRVHTGSGNTGDTLLVGATSSNERAFGTLRSGTLIPTIGAVFTNDTGVEITSLSISYTVEHWRLGAADRADRLDFQYQVDTSSITTESGWTDVDDLDALSVVTSGTGAKDGNANSTNVSATITGLSIAPGQSFTIRWVDFDATGSDDILAVDNFSLTAIPEPTTYAAIFGLATLGFVALRRRNS